jgi:hypothetical protein
MDLVAPALLTGAVLGVLTGGSLRRVVDVRLRAWWLLAPAVGLQVVLALWHPGDGWRPGAALAASLGSLGLVALFCAANARLTGMPVVLLGVLMNTGVVAANGAMPVRLPAGASASERASMEESATHRPERDGDRVSFLGAIVPIPGPFGRASFGDLVVAVALVDVVYRASRPPRPRRRSETASGAEGDPVPVVGVDDAGEGVEDPAVVEVGLH